MRWRYIKGFEGRYEVSETGAVRNSRTGRVLRPQKFPNGYRFVQLGLYGGSHLVHRLVAQAFIPVEDADTLQVNHKNGVRDDNAALNLEWLSCSDNHKHSYASLCRKPHALIKPVRLVKDAEVLQFPTQADAAKHLGVVTNSIGSAVRRGHKCKGYKVEYV